MVECVGCRQTLKNGKAYSNHQRACKKYKAAGAFRLRQMQLKKVERAQLNVTTNEEPNGLLSNDDIQDLKHEVVAVSYFSNDFSRLTLPHWNIGRNYS
jgi:molecular chaperone DnaK (HSP70)